VSILKLQITNVKYILRNIILTLEIAYIKRRKTVKRNNLGYLGLLGLLGLFGITTRNYWIFGYFGFFGFFGMLRTSSNDERIDANINRACRNAFAFFAAVVTLFTVYTLSATTYDATPLFVALLSQGITVFGISYTHYNGIEA
jgi:hypothetical protein